MTRAQGFDKAAIVLGTASIASVVFVFEGLGDFRFMTVEGPSIAIALILGALAVIAGATGRGALAAASGLAFGAAAVLQLVATANDATWLGANLSTMSFWIGLAVGLVLSGTAPRTPAPDERE